MKGVSVGDVIVQMPRGTLFVGVLVWQVPNRVVTELTWRPTSPGSGAAVWVGDVVARICGKSMAKNNVVVSILIL